MYTLLLLSIASIISILCGNYIGYKKGYKEGYEDGELYNVYDDTI
jgi:hypothetical protein